MNGRKGLLAAFLLLAVGGIFLSPGAVTANPLLRIDDLTDSVSFLVSVRTPAGGTTDGFSAFSVNGNPVTVDANGDGSSGGLSEANAITFTGTWLDSGTSGSNTFSQERDFYFVEGPLNSAGGIGQDVSDILRVFSVANLTGGTCSATNKCTFTISGSFQSDNEDNLGVVPTSANLNRIMVEDGTFVTFLNPDELRVQVRSDIPEPATLALLGMGLAGLGFSRRNR